MNKEQDIYNALKHICRLYGFFDVKQQSFTYGSLYKIDDSTTLHTIEFIKRDPQTCSFDVINCFNVAMHLPNNKFGVTSPILNFCIIEPTWQSAVEELEKCAHDGYVCEVYGIGSLMLPYETFEQAMIRLELEASARQNEDKSLLK